MPNLSMEAINVKYLALFLIVAPTIISWFLIITDKTWMDFFLTMALITVFCCFTSFILAVLGIS